MSKQTKVATMTTLEARQIAAKIEKISGIYYGVEHQAEWGDLNPNIVMVFNRATGEYVTTIHSCTEFVAWMANF